MLGQWVSPVSCDIIFNFFPAVLSRSGCAVLANAEI